MHLYILGAGASKPDGSPITSELIDEALCNFGGKSEGEALDELIGPWDRKEAIQIFRPVFELFDGFYNTNLVGKLDTYHREGYHPSNLTVSTNMIEDFILPSIFAFLPLLLVDFFALFFPLIFERGRF